MPGRTHWEDRQERGAGEDRTQAAARTQICLSCADLKSLPKASLFRECVSTNCEVNEVLELVRVFVTEKMIIIQE